MRRIRRWESWAVGIAGVATLIFWLARPRAIEVDVMVVTPGTLRTTIDEPGLTHMARHREVVAPISGEVLESPRKVGDSVRTGDVVAIMRAAPLDPRTLAEASAAADAALAGQSEATAATRQALLTLDDARRTRQRVERLAGAGGVAARDVEAAFTAESVSLRAVDGARSRERAAEGNVRRARAALRPASGPARLSLRSPIDGRILRLHEEHARVVPAGTTLMEVGDLASAELVMDVLSSDALAVAPGQRVRIGLAGGDSTWGRVTRVEPAAFPKVSPLGIEEQRVRVTVRFEGTAPLLGDRYELPASIVVWERTDALAVPATALIPVDSGWGVLMVRANRARLAKVQRGHVGARALELLSGVGAGDTVILLPSDRVRDGARVSARFR